MTGWARIHQQVVDSFARGWAAPHPHAWDEFLAEDVELAQPMLRHSSGSAAWWDEVGRLLAFLPDLRGEVLNWAGRQECLFIELRLSATLGHRSLSFRAVDQLVVTGSGYVTRRDSFFDSAPLALAVLRRPSRWLAWWRSGLGPLLVRRRPPTPGGFGVLKSTASNPLTYRALYQLLRVRRSWRWRNTYGWLAKYPIPAAAMDSYVRPVLSERAIRVDGRKAIGSVSERYFVTG